MFGHAALLTERTDSRDVAAEPHFLGTVGAWGKLDDGMQGNLHPWRFFLMDVHVVGVDAAQDCLMSHNHDVLTTFQLHDDGFQADDDIAIALSATVAIVVFVVVAGLEILGVALLDFGVGQTIANARVKLIKCLPREVAVAAGRIDEMLSSLDGTLEG